MLKGIAAVWMPVQDIERAKTFYRDTLGLPITKEDGEWAEVDANGLTLGLNGRRALRRAGRGRSGRDFPTRGRPGRDGQRPPESGRGGTRRHLGRPLGSRRDLGCDPKLQKYLSYSSAPC